nr:GIY-YIG nuclease family protein [uncultured Agathobaculum sp.]
MTGYTYLLRCADGTLYCGWTNNLTARLAAHNSGHGAKYTRGRGPVTLVYSELFESQSEAMRREAEIKRMTRAQKQALIDTQAGAEPLTVYDADGRPCGDRPRAIVHAQGLFHHVCHLWAVGVRNGAPGIWLQQRQFDRPLYPGGFDLSATGHIDPGETPREAVLREAHEEIGLALSPDALLDGESYRQQYDRGKRMGFDDELAFAWLTRMDGVPPFCPGSEVADMAFVPLADFAAAHERVCDLIGRCTDGRTITIPHASLCCLHPDEWTGVREQIARLLA